MQVTAFLQFWSFLAVACLGIASVALPLLLGRHPTCDLPFCVPRGAAVPRSELLVLPLLCSSVGHFLLTASEFTNPVL